jgi:hypothetical protein
MNLWQKERRNSGYKRRSWDSKIFVAMAGLVCDYDEEGKKCK